MIACCRDSILEVSHGQEEDLGGIGSLSLVADPVAAAGLDTVLGLVDIVDGPHTAGPHYGTAAAAGPNLAAGPNSVDVLGMVLVEDIAAAPDKTAALDTIVDLDFAAGPNRAIAVAAEDTVGEWDVGLAALA